MNSQEKLKEARCNARQARASHKDNLSNLKFWSEPPNLNKYVEDVSYYTKHSIRSAAIVKMAEADVAIAKACVAKEKAEIEWEDAWKEAQNAGQTWMPSYL